MTSFLKLSLVSLLAFYVVWACRTSQNSPELGSAVQHVASEESAYDSAYISSYDSVYDASYSSNNSADGQINCGYDDGANRVKDSFSYSEVAPARSARVAAQAVNCRSSAAVSSPVKKSFRRNTQLKFASHFRLDNRGICWFEVREAQCWVAARTSMLELQY